MPSPRPVDAPCPLVAETPAAADHFVGYHDLCPWRADDACLALHRVAPGVAGLPDGSAVAEVGLWAGAGRPFEPLAETRAWNWQIGARPLWLPGPHPRLVYNRCEGGAPGAEIMDLETGARAALPFTVFAIAPDGQSALSPHFGRLARYWPAYGYAGIAGAPQIDLAAPAEDGIWRIDLATGALSLFVSVAAAAALAPAGLTGGAAQFLAHPSISPNAKRVVFLHRFFTPDGALYSRLLVSDMAGGALACVAEERVSHFVWLDDDTLIVWMRIGAAARLRKAGLLGAPLLRPLVRLARRMRPGLRRALLNEAYFVLPLDAPSLRRAIARGLLDRDGHPMLTRDRRWMVTDTYADAAGRQALILYDRDEDRRYDIATVPAVATHPDLKCDLHPRWNHAETRIAVDANRAGRRQVLLFDPSPVIGGVS